MNVPEIAQQVNDKLNGGDESKFDITFIIVNRFLSAHKTYDIPFAKETLLCGYYDSVIVGLINTYISSPISSEGRLSMINYLHEKFEGFRIYLSGLSDQPVLPDDIMLELGTPEDY